MSHRGDHRPTLHPSLAVGCCCCRVWPRALDRGKAIRRTGLPPSRLDHRHMLVGILGPMARCTSLPRHAPSGCVGCNRASGTGCVLRTQPVQPVQVLYWCGQRCSEAPGQSALARAPRFSAGRLRGFTGSRPGVLCGWCRADLTPREKDVSHSGLGQESSRTPPRAPPFNPSQYSRSTAMGLQTAKGGGGGGRSGLAMAVLGERSPWMVAVQTWRPLDSYC